MSSQLLHSAGMAHFVEWCSATVVEMVKDGEQFDSCCLGFHFESRSLFRLFVLGQ